MEEIPMMTVERMQLDPEEKRASAHTAAATMSVKVLAQLESVEAGTSMSPQKKIKSKGKGGNFEEAKSEPTMNSLKPSFENFIKLQASSGFWVANSREILSQCIEGGTTEDTGVLQALSELGVKSEAMEQVYLTLLALFLLQEAYMDKEDEWQMIARKAKTFLG